MRVGAPANAGVVEGSKSRTRGKVLFDFEPAVYVRRKARASSPTRK
jgi:hypothetical protein